jgi:hypothetical protein
MAKGAENLFMFAFQRPRMPGLFTGRRRSPEGKKGAALGNGVADRTRARQNLSCVTHMAIIVTSETSGPISMADVVGISFPVDLHGRKDIQVINDRDSLDGLINQGFLIPKNLWIVLGIIFLNEFLHGLMYIFLIAIVPDQEIQGKSLDPG